jgi:hypothetical protein
MGWRGGRLGSMAAITSGRPPGPVDARCVVVFHDGLLLQPRVDND